MSKKKIIILKLGCMLCVAIIFTIGMVIYNKINPSPYSSIKLRNVTSSIPDVFFEDNESNYYKTDDVFYLIGNNNEYWIAGMELQNLSESDVGNAYVYSSKSLKMLQNAESSGQIISGIRKGTGLLGKLKVEGMGSIEKPSYTKYYFSSTEELEGKNYQVYILFLVQGDVRYMQINLLDEEHALTGGQKEHMRLMTGCDRYQDENGNKLY